jgi:hypothetical protein
MKKDENQESGMNEYEFTLRFDATRVSLDPSAWVEALGEAGCDDATIGVGIPGRIALMFTREAESAEDAVLSALQGVRVALPQVRLVEASPDLVGITEIAEMVGKTRQNMRKLLLSSDPNSPLPVHEGSSYVWHLAPVLTWLRAEKRYSIPDALLDVANTNMRVNAASSPVALDLRNRLDAEELWAEA